jgi:hypothetical protein
MPRFYRRQMPIDAIQFDGTPESRIAIKHLAAGFVDIETPTPMLVTSRLGTVLVIKGDWIVRENLSKEFPFTLFTPQAFLATFEAAKEGEPCSHPDSPVRDG